MTYTPGPWTIVPRGFLDGYGVQFSDGTLAVRLGLTEADARLIAAAPDLLAALRAVSASVLTPGGLGGEGGYTTLSGDTYRVMRAALLKAEGREKP